jgi:stage II sporulation protein D
MRIVRSRSFRATPVVAAALLLAACVENPTAPLAPSLDVEAASADVIEAFSGNIRIGVVPSAASVTVGSPGEWVLRDRVTGAALLSGNGDVATVTFQGVVAKYRLQVTCGSLAAVDAWKARAQAEGVVTYTEFVPAANCTRLYLGEFASNASFSVRNAFRNQMISKGLSLTDSFWRVVGTGTATYNVTRGSDVLQTPNPVTLSSPGGVVRIGTRDYRGTAEVRVNAGGTLAGINELPMEQYLYGVVPAELSPAIWPELEAIKAQAVAARTYAMSNLGKRASDGYDLLATTSDQVYGGIAVEQPMSTEAVDATARIVAKYDGALIVAFYSSTSGGHTANNEESFATETPIPYLRGVPDQERGNSLDHVPSLEVFKAHGNIGSLRGWHGGQFEAGHSSRHRWTYEWSAAEIAQVASAYAGRDVGSVHAVNVLERGPSGRALRLEFVTDSGSFFATKDGIRAALKYFPNPTTMSNLPSTLFFIEPVLDRRTGEVDGFVAYGGGFGHGVGLSQTGAVGMAEKGHSYEEILKHYYRGITLEPGY